MALDSQTTKEIKDDWGNLNFLNHFDSSCRVKLSQLDSKVTNAEKHVDLLEAQVQRILRQQAHQHQALSSTQQSSAANE
uniref:Uncharacterized protein n=1 Tax=Trichobilharzia regenti TaxID=157069 RepID=A0AA85KDG2_TRIRE|nr:unnamed protein product [Trichobilharzia regenti]